MPRPIRALFVAVALVALTACPSIRLAEPAGQADAAPIRVAGTYVHPASGLEFPEQVGTFRRADILALDRDGPTLVVGYNHEEAGASVAATVYAWKAPTSGEDASLERQFERERDGVRQFHEGAREDGSRAVSFSVRGRPVPGFAAEFHYSDVFNYTLQAVDSFLYVFERDGWIIKYRISVAERQRAAAEPIAREFLRNAPWGSYAGA